MPLMSKNNQHSFKFRFRCWSSPVLSRPSENHLNHSKTHTRDKRVLNIDLSQQLIYSTQLEFLFKFTNKFLVNLLLVFFITHCNRYNNKTRLLLISIDKLQLKRHKRVGMVNTASCLPMHLFPLLPLYGTFSVRSLVIQ